MYDIDNKLFLSSRKMEFLATSSKIEICPCDYVAATVATLTDLGFLWFREFYLESSRVIQVKTLFLTMLPYIAYTGLSDSVPNFSCCTCMVVPLHS